MVNNSIRKKLTAAFLVCILVFGSLAAYVGYREKLASEQKIYRDYLTHCSALVASTLNDVSVEELLVAKRQTLYPKYATKLENIREEMRLKYVYIYIPSEDAKSLVNLFALGMKEDEAWKPGQTVAADLNQKVLDVYQGTKKSAIVTTTNQYGYVLTAYCPVYGPDGQIQAIAGTDLARENLMKRFIQDTSGSLALIFAGCAVMLLVLLFLSKRLVILPLEKLTLYVENFVKSKKHGGAFAHIKVKSTDELGRMAESFNTMSDDMDRYMNQVTEMTISAEKTNTELAVAQKIQERSLPDGHNPYPDDTRLQLFASMKPAKQVGGDFYDFFWIDDLRLCVVIGDVSGKGITAALFMMRAKTLIKECVLRGGPLSEVLNTANLDLCERNEEEMFVTLFLGILNTESGQFQYANAGHNPPYKGSQEFHSMLPECTCPLGVFDEEEYIDEERLLTPGDGIFLYTDGVTEAENREQELFGEPAMLTVLNNHSKSDCASIEASMREAICAFTDGAEQSDDITILMLRFQGTHPLIV